MHAGPPGGIEREGELTFRPCNTSKVDETLEDTEQNVVHAWSGCGISTFAEHKRGGDFCIAGDLGSCMHSMIAQGRHTPSNPAIEIVCWCLAGARSA